MTGQATTVRVLAPTHAQLTDLAAKLDRSITQVVADAVAAYARQVFWDECQAAYARLQADPAAWADYQAELRAWDGTLADGLESEDWRGWPGGEALANEVGAAGGQEGAGGHGAASAAAGGRPSAGELWWVELGQLAPPAYFVGAVGHEQAGQRPAVIVSTDAFHALPPRLCVVVPLATRRRDVPLHVEVTPADGDVHQVSYAMCEGVRSVSQERLWRRLGHVSPATLASVQQRLRLILGL